MTPLSSKHAARRAQTANHKKRALRLLGPIRGVQRAIKDAEHMADCSCHMCGNPRKHFKTVTLAEERAVQATKAAIADLEAE